MNLDAEKKIMMENHLIGRGISDNRVLKAMQTVRREYFITNDLITQTYDDNALPSLNGQTISQPYIVALMSEQLDVFPGAKVLEIGTGTGYQTAILWNLSHEIYTIEKSAELQTFAKTNLIKCGYSGIQFRTGSGFMGWPEEAPFDRIIVTCAPETIPDKLLSQLKNNGIMLIPVGNRGIQNLIRIDKFNNSIFIKDICAVKFVPMIE